MLARARELALQPALAHRLGGRGGRRTAARLPDGRLLQAPVVDRGVVDRLARVEDPARAADRLARDRESRRPQHPARAGRVRRPVVGVVAVERVLRIELHEAQVGQRGIDVRERAKATVADEQRVVEQLRLEHEDGVGVADVPDAVQRQQRVAQVIEQAEEQHEVEGSVALGGEVVDVPDVEVDVRSEQLARDRKAGLGGIHVVDRDDLGSAPFQLEGEVAVARADVEHSQPVVACRQIELAKRVGRVVDPGRRDARSDLDLVIPMRDRRDPLADLLVAH